MVFCLPVCWIVSHSAIQKIFTYSNKIIYGKAKGKIVQKDYKIKQNKTNIKGNAHSSLNFQQILRTSQPHQRTLYEN